MLYAGLPYHDNDDRIPPADDGDHGSVDSSNDTDTEYQPGDDENSDTSYQPGDDNGDDDSDANNDTNHKENGNEFPELEPQM